MTPNMIPNIDFASLIQQIQGQQGGAALDAPMGGTPNVQTEPGKKPKPEYSQDLQQFQALAKYMKETEDKQRQAQESAELARQQAYQIRKNAVNQPTPKAPGFPVRPGEGGMLAIGALLAKALGVDERTVGGFLQGYIGTKANDQASGYQQKLLDVQRQQQLAELEAQQQDYIGASASKEAASKGDMAERLGLLDIQTQINEKTKKSDAYFNALAKYQAGNGTPFDKKQDFVALKLAAEASGNPLPPEVLASQAKIFEDADAQMLKEKADKSALTEQNALIAKLPGLGPEARGQAAKRIVALAEKRGVPWENGVAFTADIAKATAKEDRDAATANFAKAKTAFQEKLNSLGYADKVARLKDAQTARANRPASNAFSDFMSFQGAMMAYQRGSSDVAEAKAAVGLAESALAQAKTRLGAMPNSPSRQKEVADAESALQYATTMRDSAISGMKAWKLGAQYVNDGAMAGLWQMLGDDEDSVESYPPITEEQAKAAIIAAKGAISGAIPGGAPATGGQVPGQPTPMGTGTIGPPVKRKPLPNGTKILGIRGN